MEFTIGLWRLKNGMTVHIGYRHHNYFLDGHPGIIDHPEFGPYPKWQVKGTETGRYSGSIAEFIACKFRSPKTIPDGMDLLERIGD